MERTNLRELRDLPEPVDLATLDLSFISLGLVLPAVRYLLTDAGRIVALVKPQFEAGKDDVPRGGIVTDRRRGGSVCCTRWPRLPQAPASTRTARSARRSPGPTATSSSSRTFGGIPRANR